MNKEPKERIGPFHLMRCLGELAVMYVMEKLRDLEVTMDDALDVWEDE